MMDAQAKYIVGIFVLCVAVTLGVVMVSQWLDFRRGRTLIDAAQFRLRLAGAIVILLVLGMMVVGVYAVHFRTLQQFALFWSICLLLLMTLVILAMADLQRVTRRRREKEAELEQEMAAFIAASAARKNGLRDESSEEPEPPTQSSPDGGAN